MEVSNQHSKPNIAKLRQVGERALLSALLTTVAATAVHAQAPVTTLPTMITENGQTGAVQGVSSGVSFLFYDPSSKPSVPSLGPQTPLTYGVTEDFNLLTPGASTAKGLGLAGAALFSDPTTTNGKNQPDKQAINQTLSYNQGAFSISFGYLNVGKMFAVGNSPSGSISGDMANRLTGERGQNGFNTGLNYNQGGTKFGIQFGTVADALQNQHRMSETMSMERDFDKSLSLSFQRTQNNAEQLASGYTSHNTNDTLHLAYSPTRSGFLLDAKSSSTFTDQGAQSNDIALKIAQKFAALNLSSQFESSTSSSPGSSSAWLTQRYDANGTLRPGLTFSGYWAKRTVQAGVDTDDFDVIMKSAETRFIELSAEYAKHEAPDGSGNGKQSLVASINPGNVGPLGPLLLNLSINNQQSQVLDGFQSYSASLAGQITSQKGFDFGLMSGAKYYLAYSTDSAGGAYATNGHQTTHSARTLRIVSAPAGKNGLSWTVNQQQRLDQNGQTLRTASDYEAKYVVNSRVNIAANTTYDTARPDGSFTDQDQRGITVNWNKSQTSALIAQYVHTRCPSQNINAEDAYTVTYSGPALGANKMDLGLGEQTKYDYSGKYALGTTANVNYGWKADEQNLLNITSKFTDWRNLGYNSQTDSTIEASGQINFQRVF